MLQFASPYFGYLLPLVTLCDVESQQLQGLSEGCMEMREAWEELHTRGMHAHGLLLLTAIFNSCPKPGARRAKNVNLLIH